MFKLLIADDEGKTTVVPLVRDEVTIGRKEGNTIRLTERNVSRKHAKLRRQGGSFFVSDLKSYNGVRVNGRRIEGEVELKSGDQIVIGDYQLALQFEGTEQIDTATTTAPTAAPPDIEGPTALVSAPPAHEPGPPARLVMVSPPAPGAEFALSRPRLRIGRAEDLEIWVNHRSISREHAEIAVENGGVFIRDLASANGVRVNGADVKQGPIQAGDVIELGQVRFRMVGAGEHFHFDAERTIQMDALPSAPGRSRAPIFIAVGIVGVALVIGIGVALSGGGGTTEPTVTPIAGSGTTVPLPTTTLAAAPPGAGGAAVEAQVASAISSCQISLNSGNFDVAIARATEALALRPGDPQATECRDAALRTQAEDTHFASGVASMRQNQLAQAVEHFDQLQDGSPYLNRPEVAEAYRGYANELLAQARTADPATAAGLASQILQLPYLDRGVQREAERFARPTAAVAAVHPERTPRGGGGGGQRAETHPVRQPDRTPTSSGGGGGGGGTTSSGGGGGGGGGGGTTTTVAGPSPDDEARTYLANGDNVCVIRILNGHARTARQLAMLAQAQRSTPGQNPCPTMARLIEQFPASSEAARYRQFHALQCQGH